MALFSWGENGCGQCGLGHSELSRSACGVEELQPLPLSLTASRWARSLSCGGSHSLVVAKGGALLGCGDNRSSQLSHAFRGEVWWMSKPCWGLPNGQRALRLACGSRHTLVLTEGGSAFACGENRRGQLGIGCAPASAADERARGERSGGVSAGFQAADTDAGCAYGDGEEWAPPHSEEQLGDVARLTPVCIPQGATVLDVACGDAHTVFLVRMPLSAEAAAPPGVLATPCNVRPEHIELERLNQLDAALAEAELEFWPNDGAIAIEHTMGGVRLDDTEPVEAELDLIEQRLRTATERLRDTEAEMGLLSDTSPQALLLGIGDPQSGVGAPPARRADIPSDVVEGQSPTPQRPSVHVASSHRALEGVSPRQGSQSRVGLSEPSHVNAAIDDDGLLGQRPRPVQQATGERQDEDHGLGAMAGGLRWFVQPLITLSCGDNRRGQLGIGDGRPYAAHPVFMLRRLGHDDVDEAGHGAASHCSRPGDDGGARFGRSCGRKSEPCFNASVCGEGWAIACGASHSVVLHVSRSGRASRPFEISGASHALSCFKCLLMACGANECGQLGVGDFNDKRELVAMRAWRDSQPKLPHSTEGLAIPSGSTPDDSSHDAHCAAQARVATCELIVQIGCGKDFTAALGASGTVYACGEADAGSTATTSVLADSRTAPAAEATGEEFMEVPLLPAAAPRHTLTRRVWRCRAPDCQARWQDASRTQSPIVSSSQEVMHPDGTSLQVLGLACAASWTDSIAVCIACKRAYGDQAIGESEQQPAQRLRLVKGDGTELQLPSGMAFPPVVERGGPDELRSHALPRSVPAPLTAGVIDGTAGVSVACGAQHGLVLIHEHALIGERLQPPLPSAMDEAMPPLICEPLAAMPVAMAPTTDDEEAALTQQPADDVDAEAMRAASRCGLGVHAQSREGVSNACGPTGAYPPGICGRHWTLRPSPARTALELFEGIEAQSSARRDVTPGACQPSDFAAARWLGTIDVRPGFTEHGVGRHPSPGPLQVDIDERTLAGHSTPSTLGPQSALAPISRSCSKPASLPLAPSSASVHQPHPQLLNAQAAISFAIATAREEALREVADVRRRADNELEQARRGIARAQREAEIARASVGAIALMTEEELVPLEAELQAALQRVQTRLAQLRQAEELRCPVCLDEEKDTALCPCGHRVCASCADTLGRLEQLRTCPICKRVVTAHLRVY